MFCDCVLGGGGGGGGGYWYNYVTSRKDGYASFLARMKDCSKPAKKVII